MRNLKEERSGTDADEGQRFQDKDDVVQRWYAGFTEDNSKRCRKSSVLSAEQSFIITKSDSVVPKRCLSPEGSDVKLPACSSPRFHLRRNTLPSVTTVSPPLHLPPLIKQPESHVQVPANVLPIKSRPMFQPHPPSSSPLSLASARAALLPLQPPTSPLVAPPGVSHSERSRRLLRRHSAQLEQIRWKQNKLDFWVSSLREAT